MTGSVAVKVDSNKSEVDNAPFPTGVNGRSSLSSSAFEDVLLGEGNAPVGILTDQSASGSGGLAQANGSQEGRQVLEAGGDVEDQEAHQDAEGHGMVRQTDSCQEDG